MSNFLSALLLAVAVAVLGGCGQTGPLYMPEETPPQAAPDSSGDTAADPLLTQ